MTPAKTATQIDRPERFHVEVSNPAQMHEFLERAYGAKVRLCNRDSVRGDRPSLIHMRTDVGQSKRFNCAATWRHQPIQSTRCSACG